MIQSRHSGNAGDSKEDGQATATGDHVYGASRSRRAIKCEKPPSRPVTPLPCYERKASHSARAQASNHHPQSSRHGGGRPGLLAATWGNTAKKGDKDVGTRFGHMAAIGSRCTLKKGL